MKFPDNICFCWVAKIQQKLKDKFYDKEKKKYKYAWAVYIGLGIYVLHWIWHIAVGAAVIGFLYQQCS
ncbi:MAG: hypothetical protein MJZ29_04265 [Bacteroidaceae bacterium]|nr:hypothetical protein [Bacteroidaceae bacterium]